MKKKSLLLTFLFITSLCMNCKSDDEASPNYNTSETGAYFPLAIGNYWIYEEESFDTSIGTGTQTGRTDTLRVIDRKLLVNIEFFVLENSRWQNNELIKSISYVRDSSGYLVDQKGRVQFSATALDQVLDTYELAPSLDIYVEYQVKDSIVVKVTDAGFFPCLDYEGRVYREGELTESRSHNYYSKGIGRVWNSYGYVANPSLEMRYLLKEYYVQ